MRDPGHDDLVPMTAIVAGTVVGIAVTIMSLLLSWEDSSGLLSGSGLFSGQTTATEVIGEHDEVRSSTETTWLDPRGPERGPTELEWDVIRTYKAIESMTETEPGPEAADQTLERLRTFAREHPDNPYVQEFYLKGLRVAEYYAAETEDRVRSTLLSARFDRHWAQVERSEGTALEKIRMLEQLLERSCLDSTKHVAELGRVAEQHPSSPAIAEALVHGLELADSRCGVSY